MILRNSPNMSIRRCPPLFLFRPRHFLQFRETRVLCHVSSPNGTQNASICLLGGWKKYVPTIGLMVIYHGAIRKNTNKNKQIQVEIGDASKPLQREQRCQIGKVTGDIYMTQNRNIMHYFLGDLQCLILPPKRVI